MNDYARKRYWKMLLLLFAVCIGFFSLWYTNGLVKKLAVEEEKKVEQWAQAIRLLVNATTTDFTTLRDSDSTQYINLDALIGDVNTFLSSIQQQNVTIPVILTDDKGQINDHRNLDPAREQDSLYLREQLELMKSEHDPIVVTFVGEQKNYIYYKNSVLLTQLKYYPYFQLSIIALFIFVSYLAFSSSRKSEQNRVWVGMSKETAHQLGTPISSMMAWIDMLKQDESPEKLELLAELQKDVERLQVITERFSKIGSEPALEQVNVYEVLQHAVSYLRSRLSSKVVFEIEPGHGGELKAYLNIPLFEWVIENLTKNAVDAMDGQGKMTYSLQKHGQFLYLDISDTGKGIAKTKFKTVFKPGYTTKKRGWGLGLSLSKRIIEDYHKGHIQVLSSEPGKGTTFRITFKI